MDGLDSLGGGGQWRGWRALALPVTAVAPASGQGAAVVHHSVVSDSATPWTVGRSYDLLLQEGMWNAMALEEGKQSSSVLQV